MPFALTVAVVCLAACSSKNTPASHANSGSEGSNSNPSATVEKLPDFTIKDTHGREVSIGAYRGKILLVDFWATWCGPCKKEMPGYEDLYRRYKKRGLMVIGVAADSDPIAVARFGKKLGITYPLLVNGMDVQKYGAPGLPTTMLVDRSGVVRKKIVGFEYTKVFESALIELLHESTDKNKSPSN